MSLTEIRQIEEELKDIDKRVKKLEDKKPWLEIIAIVISLFSLIGYYPQFKELKEDIKYKKFMTGYSKAYSEVVNNYINGKEDSSPLDNYILDKGGDTEESFKEEVINRIKYKVNNNEYNKSLKYTYTFNYSAHVSAKETKSNDLIIISGVTTKVGDSEPYTDAEGRVYEIVEDKNLKSIKIVDRYFTKSNTKEYLDIK